MPRIPPVLADALLAGAIATAVAVVWIRAIGPLSRSAVVICAAADGPPSRAA
jgi:hypothetical protein